MALTNKQRAFVEHYLGDAQWNATEAASLAGYEGNRDTLGSVASENLHKLEIKEYIQQRLQDMGASTQELIHLWLRRIRADISPFVNNRGLDLEGMKKAGLGHLIKGVRKTARMTNIELRDPDKAEELLAKHLGMFVERHEVKTQAVTELEWPDEGGIAPVTQDPEGGA